MPCNNNDDDDDDVWILPEKSPHYIEGRKVLSKAWKILIYLDTIVLTVGKNQQWIKPV